eukprot:Skav205241  [mRNA]  locus=scaffold1794:280770:281435:- [translate_table: standard]
MVPKPQTSTEASHVRAETPGPAKILATTLPRELFRGVPLWLCLASFEKHWKNNVGDGVSDFAFSEEVEFLDDFLSHDWATSRWSKLCAMLVVYNAKAAAVAAILTTLFWSLLAKAAFMPPDIKKEQWLFDYCIFTGPVIVIFYMVLIFWQRIKSMFTKTGMVFLDKLCISQHDMSKKEEGIAGLAAFLSNSRRMVILWSPRNLSFNLACLSQLHTLIVHYT